MAALKVLSLAAARRRIGSVVMDGGTLIDWRISDKAADSRDNAVAHACKLFDEFSPDLVVTEDVFHAMHKGPRAKALITAIVEAAEARGLFTVAVPHVSRFPNKYAEADALVERFPELAPWKPEKRRFYDNEPRNTVLFEALALALQISDSRAPNLS